MLNDNNLSKILGVSFPKMEVSDIHWKSQDSNKDSILFYKISPDETSQKLFTERIQNSQFAWLVVNIDHPSRPINSSVINEKEWPRVQKLILDELYPCPKLKLLALTGTNGKTTTTDLVLQLGELIGKKGLSIGTLGVRAHNKTILDFGLTSPSLIDLRKVLHQHGQGKDFCVLEASSHALAQERFYGLQFDMAGWLSFSQDHLDYHKTMEEYFAAKCLLVNYLSPSAHIFVPQSGVKIFNGLKKITNQINFASAIETKLPLFFTPSFNRRNLEVAVAMIEQTFQIKVDDIFNRIKPPDGRFYIRQYKTSYIVVDFAHTPDALDNICRGIKEAFPYHRLKILFGCGGDRDKSKRALMGKIAETYGDEIYLTSDNPRSESPEAIIRDIASGMSSSRIHQIVERPEAVQRAFAALEENEVLLLAGKGHEDYILKDGVKHPYSDIKEVERFLMERSL